MIQKNSIASAKLVSEVLLQKNSLIYSSNSKTLQLWFKVILDSMLYKKPLCISFYSTT
jgi:hypothetical protein